MTRLLTKVAVVATFAALAFAATALANTLHYGDAHRLAVRLAVKQTHVKNHPVDRWHISGATRSGPHQIAWVYTVDYSDGTLCDGELVVRLSHSTGVGRAFFRDVHCEH
ncbi:MAG: hypothetical protein QOK25_2646 [Thermoleophilaceae bacterium]|nr:hypothetical protein [Thermoleophilaceae bacterium]